jgi:hypothetical protein
MEFDEFNLTDSRLSDPTQFPITANQLKYSLFVLAYLLGRDFIKYAIPILKEYLLKPTVVHEKLS